MTNDRIEQRDEIPQNREKDIVSWDSNHTLCAIRADVLSQLD